MVLDLFLLTDGIKLEPCNLGKFFFSFFLFHKLSLENMDRIFLEIKQNSFLSPPPPFFFVSPPPPTTNLDSSGFDLNNKVSPSLLLIIVILAIIFFLSGLLHLLVRFLLRPPNRNPDDFDSVSALQGQLQQLFHLHDSGVDQSFIDTLPVFHYKAIIGLKDPFDCAVCLCEFECEDKLRLLPKCSHAFHMECIDTWLLSHSTCPLCRACLLSDFSQNNSRTPYVLVLESGSESSREIIPDRESSAFGVPNSVARTGSHLGCYTDDDLGSSRIDPSRKSSEIHDVGAAAVVGSGEKVVQVKLGKFKNVDGNGGGEGSTSNGGNGGDNNAEARRCFSMGSFEYVMDENSSLQVPIRTPMKKKKNQSSKKPSLPLTPGHRQAMSECDCDSRREFNGFDPFKGLADIHGGCSSSSISNSGNVIGRSKRESFSVSKIWMRATKKEKDHNSPSENSSSRRAFSFRFPVQKNASGGVAAAADDDDLKMKNNGGRRSSAEIGMVGNWEVNGNGNGNELGGGGFDVENQSCNSCNSSNLTDSQAKTPSFARRTLHWLVGRQNKVVHSSFGPADV